MLFLTRSGIPLEVIWDRWFMKIEGLVPKHVLCEKPVEKCFKALQRVEDPKNSIEKQYLFSVYVHPPPSKEPTFSNDSIFFGREVPRRHLVSQAPHLLL